MTEAEQFQEALQVAEAGSMLERDIIAQLLEAHDKARDQKLADLVAGLEAAVDLADHNHTWIDAETNNLPSSFCVRCKLNALLRSVKGKEVWG